MGTLLLRHGGEQIWAGSASAAMEGLRSFKNSLARDTNPTSLLLEVSPSTHIAEQFHFSKSNGCKMLCLRALLLYSDLDT